MRLRLVDAPESWPDEEADEPQVKPRASRCFITKAYFESEGRTCCDRACGSCYCCAKVQKSKCDFCGIELPYSHLTGIFRRKGACFKCEERLLELLVPRKLPSVNTSLWDDGY